MATAFTLIAKVKAEHEKRYLEYTGPADESGKLSNPGFERISINDIGPGISKSDSPGDQDRRT